MKYLFVPIEIAHKLKELGFDDPCLAHYSTDPDCEEIFHQLANPSLEDSEYTFPITSIFGVHSNTGNDGISAPLYQQVVDWFREKHNISIEISWSPSYEYDKGKWADAIWEIVFINVKDPTCTQSVDYQRKSGEQFEYYPTLTKAIALAFDLIKTTGQ